MTIGGPQRNDGVYSESRITEGEKPLTEAERQIEAELDPALVDLLTDFYARADALTGRSPDSTIDFFTSISFRSFGWMCSSAGRQLFLAD